MNSFQDLNNYSIQPVNYADNSSYSLIFGPFAGNANIVANTSVTHTLENRQPILVFENSVKSLFVIVTSPQDIEGIPIANIQYTGNNANIQLTKNNSTQWAIGNIWTVADYNETFANTVVSIEGLRQEDFTYSTLVTDQQGNSVTFTTTVDVQPFGFSRPTTVVFNEDANTDITGMAITDLSNQNYTLTFDLLPANAGNIKLNANSYTSNSFVLTGNRNAINANLAGNVTYIPYFDYTSNSNVSVNIFNNTTNANIGTANIRLLIGATHDDYSAPSEIIRGQGNSNVGTATGSANLRITDLAQGCNYTSNVSLLTPSIGNLWIANTNYGNVISLSGNITAVNSNLANIILVSNTSTLTDGNLRYVQTNTTANLIQGNITIPVTYIPISKHVRSGVEKPLGTRIGANATANVDFWCYNWNVIEQSDPGYPGDDKIYRYSPFYTTGPNNSNVSITDFRETTIFKWPSSSIKIENTYNGNTGRGITGAFDTGMDSSSTGQFFSFWIYPRQQAGYYCFAGLINDSAANYELGSGLFNTSSNKMIGWFFHWEAGYVTLSRAYPAIVRNPGQPSYYNGSHINLGYVYANEWTNIAFQRTAGTSETYSVWIRGQPATDFRGPGSTTNPNGTAYNGTTWNPWSPEIDNWNKFVFGAPCPPGAAPGAESGDIGYFNNAINPYAMNMYIDDIVIANNAPYTNLQPFTPVLQTYSGNVRQLWTGA